MSLTIDEATAISRRVASEVDPRFKVVGVTANDREAGRLEMLITVEGCHREPCLLLVNLPRAESAALQDALRRELAHTLRQHAGATDEG